MIFIGTSNHEFAFVSSTSDLVTGTALTLPSYSAGDILVCFIIKFDSSNTFVTPSGWTQGVNSTSSSSVQTNTLFKIMNGSEGSSITVVTSSEGLYYSFLKLSGSFTTLTAGSLNAQSTGGNPSSQTITMSSLTDPAIGFGFVSAYTSSGTASDAAFSTFSPTEDATISYVGIGNRIKYKISYKIYNSSPSNITVDANDLFAQTTLMSMYIKGT